MSYKKAYLAISATFFSSWLLSCEMKYAIGSDVMVYSQCAERTLHKIQKKKNSMGPSCGERAYFRGSEYVLFKILD